MTVPATLAIAGGIACLGLAIAGIARRPRRPTQLFFAAGMTSLAIESAFNAMSLNSSVPGEIIYWQKFRLLAMSFLPGMWLCFGFMYSRGNYQEFMARWRVGWTLAFVVPISLAIWQRDHLLVRAEYLSTGSGWVILLGAPSSFLIVLFLLSSILVLLNLERTLRVSVGTMRWRVKYMVIGLGLLFAVRIYLCGQALLYSSLNLPLEDVNSVALLLACGLIAVALYRDGIFGVDLYPSQRLLQNSLTLFLAGGYLFVVGVMAKVAPLLGMDAYLPLNAFFLLLAAIGLSVILLSDRLRLQTHQFVSRHFGRPHYDYRQVWTSFMERTTFRVQSADLCTAVVGWVSETFQLLSATIWLVDQTTGRLIFGAYTAAARRSDSPLDLDAAGTRVLDGLRLAPHPIGLDESTEPWVKTLASVDPDCVGTRGPHLLVPIFGRGDLLGLMLLSDRVGNTPFSDEDKELLKCVGDQMAGSLLNIELSQRLLRLKEMEAFQSMSAFFVHDLKNTASTLSLMLQNIPAHFDDPEFRKDSLRALSTSVGRIDQLISRLTMLREEVELKPSDADLAEVAERAVADLDGLAELKLLRLLPPVPTVTIDIDKIRKVITNLLANAVDATGAGGQIRLETGSRPGWVWVSVADNGAGMSPEFVNQSLFRPFRSTKKGGIGIGMFLSKMIVEAHQGRIEVESQLGKGTVFKVLLPLKS
jgi:putative PEP-CTERM system histidine kinase